jgi:hypothetical protein
MCYLEIYIIFFCILLDDIGPDLSHTKNLYFIIYFLLSFLSIRDTFMSVKLLNDTFPLFIN